MLIRIYIICTVWISALVIGCSSSGHVYPGDNENDDSTTTGAMIFVPSGEFIMGSNLGSFGHSDDESPSHEVWLDAYYISIHEVTNREYSAFLSDSTVENTYWNNQMEIVPVGSGFRAIEGLEDYPVRYVSWYGAQTYAEWIGGRLPTEAEWEKAARGPNDMRYFPWGDHISSGQANYYNAGGLWEVETATGKSFYGCYDMAGNVWEWTSDWYDADFYRQSPYRNPTGPVIGEFKSVRGGGFLNSEEQVRCSERWGVNPRYALEDLGFRCVIDSVDF